MFGSQPTKTRQLLSADPGRSPDGWSKEHYMPLSTLPDQLMGVIAAYCVTAKVFTEAESAQNRCQIGNMGLALKVINDWLDETGGRVVRGFSKTS